MDDSDSDTERDIIELQTVLLPSVKNTHKPLHEDVNLEVYKTALEHNKRCDEILKFMLCKLKSCLQVSTKKLENVRRLINSGPTGGYVSHDIGYYRLGFPYFKDLADFPCPPNSDVEKVNKFGIELYSEKRVLKWSGAQKLALFNEISFAVKKKIKYEIGIEIKKIQIEIDQIKSTQTTEQNVRLIELENSLCDQHLKLANLKEQPLESLVLPLKDNQEFDWEAISLKGGKKISHTPNECRTMWRVFLHPEISKQGWTMEEQSNLKRLALQYNLQDWERIAQDLGSNRSSYQCFLFYRLRLINVHARSWTPQEDNYLKSLVQTCKIGNFIPWSKVAYYMENRSKNQCYNRWIYSVSRNLKGRFLQEEDDVIMSGIKEFGTNFRKISQYLPQRTVKGIKKRYDILSTNLKDTSPLIWNIKTDKMLWNLITRVKQKNNVIDFTSICDHFHNTTPDALKRRYDLLEQWLNKSSRNNIDNAPRKPVKRLSQGDNMEEGMSFSRAVELYQEKLLSISETKPKVKNPNYNVNKKLNQYFLNQVTAKESMGLPKVTHTKPSTEMDFINLRNILILLGAKLDKTLVSKCRSQEKRLYLKDIVDKLEKLDDKVTEVPRADTMVMRTYSRKKKSVSDPLNNTINPNTTPASIISPDARLLRTYSRKNQQTSKSVIDNVIPSSPLPTSIWHNNEICDPSLPLYVFPPTYCTISAFKSIILRCKTNPQATVTLNDGIKDYVSRWNKRFDMLFLWPANLSNIPPCLHNTIFDEQLLESNANTRDVNIIGVDQPSTSGTSVSDSGTKRKAHNQRRVSKRLKKGKNEGA